MFTLSVCFLQWEPTQEGYLRFLVESKVVYDALEQIVQNAPVPECEYQVHMHILAPVLHLVNFPRHHHHTLPFTQTDIYVPVSV